MGKVDEMVDATVVEGPTDCNDIAAPGGLQFVGDEEAGLPVY